MLRETAMRFKVLILVPTLLSASVIGTRAESAIDDATAIQETASTNARGGLPTALKMTPQRKPCNAERRALIGAAVGSVIAMAAVRKAAESNDGTIGAKGTLHAGGYGAALDVFVGLKTCW